MNAIPIMFNYDDDVTNHHLRIPISAFKKPETDAEYAKLEALLDKMIDIVRDDEAHPLALAMQIIGDNMEAYDSEQHPAIGNDVSDIEMVKYLMSTNNLAQKDLADIFGGQANVSKFLTGKRKLSSSQIAGLKHKFHISADFFIR